MDIGKLKKFFYGFWILLIVIAVGYYLSHPNFFKVENLKELFESYRGSIWMLYIVISFIRGFFLIPSTPFVLLGIALFPTEPWHVLGVSMAGVVFSASLLYFFSDSIGFSKYLEEKYPDRIGWVQEKLSGNRALVFIYLWSIFPLVPTDLICYVAGILKLKYWKLVSGVFGGEMTLNTFYVFFMHSVFDLT